MKNILVTTLLLFLILITKGISQTQFDFPLHPGDVMVYKPLSVRSSMSSTNLEVKTIIEIQYGIGNSDHNNDTVIYWQSNENWGGYVAMVNQRNMLTYTSTDSRWTSELYPVVPPISDQFILIHTRPFGSDTTIHRITRRFDTTIFNLNVFAFTIDDGRTIADHFGVIRECKYDTVVLSSAMIKGIKYNWDERTWNMNPLCIGNNYEWFYMRPYSGEKVSIRIVNDTVINGRRYFILQDENAKLYKLLREEYFNLYIWQDGRDQPYFLSNAVPGMVTNSYIVIDTATVELSGQKRRIVHAQDIDQNWFDTFLEGISRIKGKYLGPTVGGWPAYDSLISARVCGFDYRTNTKVHESNVSTFQLYQNAPNPFSYITIISYQIAVRAHVRLEIFDLLGRKIATLVDEEKDAGEYTSTFRPGEPSVNIHQGVYFYKLTIGNNVMTKKMIVIK